MTTTPEAEKKTHHGRNAKRIREILGVKQDVLAQELGLSQQAVSLLEQKEVLEPEVLDKVAKALRVSPEAIKGFTEEAAINYFNSFNDNSVNNGVVYAFNSTINPIEKWMAVVEENKKLYERLLESEREKLALLKSLQRT